MKRNTNAQPAGRGNRLAARAKVLAQRLEALRRNRYAKKRLALRATAILLRLVALSCGLYSFLCAYLLVPSILGSIPIAWHMLVFATTGGMFWFVDLTNSANHVDAQIYRLLAAEWRDAALSGMIPRDRQHIG